jgi:hypothetical protein
LVCEFTFFFIYMLPSSLRGYGTCNFFVFWMFKYPTHKFGSKYCPVLPLFLTATYLLFSRILSTVITSLHGFASWRLHTPYQVRCNDASWSLNASLRNSIILCSNGFQTFSVSGGVGNAEILCHRSILEPSVTFQGRHILKFLYKEVHILATREWLCSQVSYFDSGQLCFILAGNFYFSSFN